MKTDTQKADERVNGHKAIWVFTPSRTDPRDLEFILVQRQRLLQDAVERVGESARTDHKHHLLFVGPRGCGKTHLVTLIVSRLTQDEALTDRMRIAWLNEDETCTTLLELLLKIHSALEKRYPDEYREHMLGAAFDMKPDAALEFVSSHLLSSLGSRTLVVVAENLDAIFDGLGDVGQKQLRAFIQENSKLSIVATAQRLVEDFASRTSPFFGFFQTEHLKPLNVEEATELLQNIARLQKKDSVVEFLSTNRGRSRVRSLHHLSGGNHRIYIVISQFITRDSIDGLVEPFMKMVDELTPYYQERIRWLPPQQRKIVEYLCSCERPVPVKEIAKRLFATPQTISSQLQDLREKGYVEAHQRGRESLYEISEPLMRIAVEVKDNQRHQPLRLIVDFLRVWYDDQELKHRLGKLELTTASYAYLESAIQKNITEGDLRTRLVIDDYTAVIELAGSPVEQVAETLFYRGVAQGQAGDTQCEIDDYTAVIELAEAPAEQVAKALFYRGITHGQVGDTRSEIDDYTAVIKLAGAPVDLVAKALVNRGVIQGRAGGTQCEIDDYTAVIELAGAPVDLVAKVLFMRGDIHRQAGNTQRAVDDYTAVVELPGAPVDVVAQTLVNRGMVHRQTGNLQHAVGDFTAVIALAEAPAEQVALALLFRGMTFFQANLKRESQADYETLVGFPDAPANSVVIAYLCLAELHFSDGKWSEGFQALEMGLECGAQVQPPYHAAAKDVIGMIFSAGLSPESRHEKVAQLLGIYSKYHALPVLGEALVQHIGGVFRAGKPFPSADNLEQWASAWEQAAESVGDFRLSVRLLRTGIDFVKAAGKDPGILLNLTSPERAILEQSLGFAEKV